MATVEVLLREDVEHLGRRGQIVRVKAGYARNYLLPRGLAVLATAANIKAVEQEKRLLERREMRERTQAEAVAERLKELVLTFPRKVGDQDMLFGSVTAMDIAAALAERGIDVDRRKILIEHPIKYLGEYTIPVKLHREVTAEIRIQVVREEGESQG
ncbi:MAG: 50S ribosomal protein L9 [Blastocatellia bacterium]|nr:50S ribosomal protein L9 [Blastocatellia bacterium]MCS7156712.1 50S ribosomal protein L9 [Blastocatellia bacterium]MCX7751546.1 50S ribosomal protein L9 [Blastocatellia bacterium]MDW8168646.1 50S ribosomal protein L9 [Acidobacteriota bacterium]MDW8256541.1 50S ribosomal protein L9 [Acidobacteriota bacterium]